MNATPMHGPHHAVQFYGSDDSLISTVGAFLSEGLAANQPAIVIATPSHSFAIQQELLKRSIDIGRALAGGDLIILDAEDTLATFMRKGRPDAREFREVIGDVIEKLIENRPDTLVRAYGEMVDVLWKRGKEDAAIRLEILWNRLASRYGFALLCGYSMGNFYKQGERFQEVCRQHTHVLDSNSP